MCTALQSSSTDVEYFASSDSTKQFSEARGKSSDCPTIPRQRKSVTQVYRELGKTYFRRSFRMSFETFSNLFNVVKADLIRVVDARSEGNS